MYKPEPIDTSGVALDEDLVELSEILAKNFHDRWARQLAAEGWQGNTARDGKQRPSRLGALAPTSMDEGRVAVCHAFGFTYKQHVSELLPYGVYTIPEVSCVGITQEQVAERAIRSVAGLAFYRDNPRGKIIGDREGLVKLVFDRETRKLFGCHCIAEHATELVHIGQSLVAYDALGRWT